MAVAETDLQRQHLIEVISDTVAVVLTELEIGTETFRLRQLANALGVTVRDLRAGLDRVNDSGWTPPGGASGFAPSIEAPEPEADRSHLQVVTEHLADVDTSKPGRGGPKTRPSPITPRRKGEPATKVCRDCVEKPIEEFILKPHYYRGKRRDDRAIRASYCHNCRKARSRMRYLTTKMADELAGILTMDLVAGDKLIGHGCAGCGKAFVAGDTVDIRIQQGVKHHEHCPG